MSKYDIESFQRSIRNKKEFKNFQNSRVLPENECDTNYPHLTFQITSLSEYVQVITLFISVVQSNFGYDLIYRGVTDKGWKLEPSIARSEGFMSEYAMTRELRTLKPEIFSGIESNFDALSLMQHYGLPTRLLDFTTNPLIALYFACEGNDKKDARVVSQLVNLKYADERQSTLIEAICSLHKVMTISDLWIEEWISKYDCTLHLYLLYMYILSGNRSLVVRPKYWNERQRHQSSIFMIFPNEVYDQGADFVFNHVEKEEGAHPDVKQHAIAISEKEDIHKLYGKNNNFIVLRKHVNKIRDIYYGSYPFDRKEDVITGFPEEENKVLKKRFRFTDGIQLIESDLMKNFYSSIIIPSKFKKRILKELDEFGIDQSFVYPEVEYTAKRIKNKFYYDE